jgi:hypothetical protein
MGSEASAMKSMEKDSSCALVTQERKYDHTPSTNHWIVDSGAKNRESMLVFTVQAWFMKGTTTISNDSCVPVVKKGSIHFLNRVYLDNALHAPDLSLNLLSIRYVRN